ARGRVRVPLRIGRLLHPEQERRRLQHGLDYCLGAFQEIVFTLEQGIVSRNLFRPERPAKGASSERTNELDPTVRDAAFRIAGNEVARVPAAERIRRYSLGSDAVGFHLNGGQRLGLVLILEAVDEVLGGELT